MLLTSFGCRRLLQVNFVGALKGNVSAPCLCRLRRRGGASPDGPHRLAKGAVLLDSGRGKLDHHPAVVQDLGLGTVSSLPAVKLRTLILPQITPQLSIRRAPIGTGDQHRLVIRPSMLDRMRGHRSCPNAKEGKKHRGYVWSGSPSKFLFLLLLLLLLHPL